MATREGSVAPRRARWGVVAVVFALVALLLGYVAATGLNGALAISGAARRPRAASAAA